MYKATEVAKLVINVCADDGHPVTNLKLQKILYFMWLEWYKKRETYLFDNRVEAWHYGPVVPDVYQTYRTSIADPIRKGDEPPIAKSDAEQLKEIALRYNKYPIGELIEMSHKDGSPWDRAGRDLVPYTEISKGLMIDEAGRLRWQRMLLSSG